MTDKTFRELTNLARIKNHSGANRPNSPAAKYDEAKQHWINSKEQSK